MDLDAVPTSADVAEFKLLFFFFPFHLLHKACHLGNLSDMKGALDGGSRTVATAPSLSEPITLVSEDLRASRGEGTWCLVSDPSTQTNPPNPLLVLINADNLSS
ncbi:hypothetical protein EYF80_014552 [Liparis tanakae]|uniref:Uncharacterized protein n=1 Tax=Liparis tanakae TaxID=230148 RepID=A0A4Z2ICI7_9TELE|nr:hypothetical protein EYF80_014552 [Liparis tanakae]